MSKNRFEERFEKRSVSTSKSQSERTNLGLQKWVDAVKGTVTEQQKMNLVFFECKIFRSVEIVGLRFSFSKL